MKRSKLEVVVTYVLLTISALILAMPFYYMIETSFKGVVEAGEPSFSFIVKKPTLESYQNLLNDGLVFRSVWNSFQVAVLTTVGSLFFCTLAGYAFAKHRFPGRNGLFILLLSTMMIPGSVLLVPSFLLMRDFGWLDTFLPLVVPSVAGAFGVFLSRQFIEKIPDSYIESAKLDGASETRVFFSLILPLAKPLLATLGILTFLGSWNNLVGPLIMLVDEKKFTLPIAVSMLQGRFPGQDNSQMAGAMISIVPLLVIFAFFQRHIVSSLASSGLKES